MGWVDADDVSAMSNRQRKKLEMAERAARLNKKPEEKAAEEAAASETAVATEVTMDIDMDGVA